jgi:hypothetical protein
MMAMRLPMAVALLALAACAAPREAGGEPPPPTGEDQETRLAKADLAARLGIDESDIEVVRREAVVWSDGSLGCPQPGMVYTQALVEGTYMELRAGGTIYAYHSGEGRPPFLCEDSEGPPEGSGTGS